MKNILKGELIKLKNSSLVFIIIILTITPILNGISISEKLSSIDSNTNTLEAIYDFSINIYTLIILPTIIVISFAIIMRFENIAGGMKEALTLPITKREFFLTKLIIGIFLVSFSILIFTIGIIVAGFFQNGITIRGINIILLRMFIIFLVSLCIMGIQYYLSISYENINISLGLGICFQMPVLLASSSKYRILYPWTYITTVNDITTLNNSVLIMITISIGIFIVFNLIGYRRFNNKDIY